MKRSAAAAMLLLAGSCRAFAPPGAAGGLRRISRHPTARSMALVDPGIVSSAREAFSSLPIADAIADADAAATAAGEVAKADSGFLGFLVGPVEGLLEIFHTGLMAVGVNQGAWGISIIAMTALIKVLTFPLTKGQLESSAKLQVRRPSWALSFLSFSLSLHPSLARSLRRLETGAISHD